MIAKIGLLLAANFVPSNYPEVILAFFEDVEKGGVYYKKLFAISDYIDSSFEYVFETDEAYQSWIDQEKLYLFVYDNSSLIYPPQEPTQQNVSSATANAQKYIIDTKANASIALTALGIECSLIS